jgi:membrane-bound ClpP family serine protease
MSLRLSLKWAIILVVILGMILMVPPLIQGDFSRAGGAFFRWAIMSIAILLIGTWDEYSSTKKDKK